jgi:hypothetical protein
LNKKVFTVPNTLDKRSVNVKKLAFKKLNRRTLFGEMEFSMVSNPE